MNRPNRLLAGCLLVLVAAIGFGAVVANRTPILRGYLQTDLDGNQYSATNFATVVATNFLSPNRYTAITNNSATFWYNGGDQRALYDGRGLFVAETNASGTVLPQVQIFDSTLSAVGGALTLYPGLAYTNAAVVRLITSSDFGQLLLGNVSNSVHTFPLTLEGYYGSVLGEIISARSYTNKSFSGTTNRVLVSGPNKTMTESGSALTDFMTNNSPLDPWLLLQREAGVDQVLKWNGEKWAAADDATADLEGAVDAATVTNIVQHALLTATNETYQWSTNYSYTATNDLFTALDFLKQQGSENLTNWSLIDTNLVAMLVHTNGLAGTNYVNQATNDLFAAIDTLKQHGSETLTNWSLISTGAVAMLVHTNGLAGTNWVIGSTNELLSHIQQAFASNSYYGISNAVNFVIATNDGPIAPSNILAAGAASGQVLKWDGEKWTPGADNSAEPDGGIDDATATNIVQYALVTATNNTYQAATNYTANLARTNDTRAVMVTNVVGASSFVTHDGKATISDGELALNADTNGQVTAASSAYPDDPLMESGATDDGGYIKLYQITGGTRTGPAIELSTDSSAGRFYSIYGIDAPTYYGLDTSVTNADGLTIAEEIAQATNGLTAFDIALYVTTTDSTPVAVWTNSLSTNAVSIMSIHVVTTDWEDWILTRMSCPDGVVSIDRTNSLRGLYTYTDNATNQLASYVASQFTTNNYVGVSNAVGFVIATNGAALDPWLLMQRSAGVGQVLKWDGSKWAAGADNSAEPDGGIDEATATNITQYALQTGTNDVYQWATNYAFAGTNSTYQAATNYTANLVRTNDSRALSFSGTVGLQETNIVARTLMGQPRIDIYSGSFSSRFEASGFGLYNPGTALLLGATEDGGYLSLGVARITGQTGGAYFSTITNAGFSGTASILVSDTQKRMVESGTALTSLATKAEVAVKANTNMPSLYNPFFYGYLDGGLWSIDGSGNATFPSITGAHIGNGAGLDSILETGVVGLHAALTYLTNRIVTTNGLAGTNYVNNATNQLRLHVASTYTTNTYGGVSNAVGFVIATNGGPVDPYQLIQKGADIGQVLKWDGTHYTPMDDISTPPDGGIDEATATNIVQHALLTATNNVYQWSTNYANTATNDLYATLNTRKQEGSVNLTNWSLLSTNDMANKADVTAATNALGTMAWRDTNDFYLASNPDGFVDATITNDLAYRVELVSATNNLDPYKLLAQGASTGQVLKWDGSKWAAGTDNSTPPDGGIDELTATNIARYQAQIATNDLYNTLDGQKIDAYEYLFSWAGIDTNAVLYPVHTNGLAGTNYVNQATNDLAALVHTKANTNMPSLYNPFFFGYIDGGLWAIDGLGNATFASVSGAHIGSGAGLTDVPESGVTGLFAALTYLTNRSGVSSFEGRTGAVTLTRPDVTNALTGDITNNTTGNAATATSADRADQANVLFVVPGAFISKAADTTPFMSYSESGTNHLTIGLPLYFGDMIFAWDSDAGLLRIIDYGDDGAVSIDNGAFYGLFDGGGGAITNLNADNLASGTVPLARLSGIRSNEIASATDTVYRADSNAVVSAGTSISVTPNTTGQVTTYTVAYTGGSGSYDINENDTHTVTSDTHMVPWSITVADGEVVRIEFFATAKGTAADCWGTLSYVGYWRRDGATMTAITMGDERYHYAKGAGLSDFIIDDTSTANTIEIRAQAASGTPTVRLMIKGHVVRNAGP